MHNLKGFVWIYKNSQVLVYIVFSISRIIDGDVKRVDSHQMEEEIKKFIQPQRNPIKTNGKVSYWEGQRAWSIIRLKQEILKEFPQLKEKSCPVGYQLRFYREFDELEKALKEMKKKQGVPPLLFWFFKE